MIKSPYYELMTFQLYPIFEIEMPVQTFKVVYV